MSFSKIEITDVDVQLTYIRSPGPGGQNTNKVATGVLLRFNVVQTSLLPADLRARIIAKIGYKLTKTGDILIKATQHRTQERNKQDALHRLRVLIQQAAIPTKIRKKTKPSKSSIKQRLAEKKAHATKKSLRKSQLHDE